MQEEIDAFAGYLENVRKASRNTVLSYRRDLTQMASYLEQQGIAEISKVTQTSLNSYILYLEGQGKATTTISRVIASVKGFFHYEIGEGKIGKDPSEILKTPKVEKKPPAILSVEEVEALVLSHPEIIGIHDLIVHDYGPGRRILSLHAEVPASGDILELHDVVDGLERQLNEELGCLATIHMDPVVNDGGVTAETRERVLALVRLIDPEITIHDFRIVPGPARTKLLFDAVVPYRCALSDQEVSSRIASGVQTLDAGWSAVVHVEKGYV